MYLIWFPIYFKCSWYLCHSLKLCCVIRTQRMWDCEIFRRHTSISIAIWTAHNRRIWRKWIRCDPPLMNQPRKAPIETVQFSEHLKVASQSRPTPTQNTFRVWQSQNICALLITWQATAVLPSRLMWVNIDGVIVTMTQLCRPNNCGSHTHNHKPPAKFQAFYIWTWIQTEIQQRYSIIGEARIPWLKSSCARFSHPAKRATLCQQHWVM